MKRAFHWFSTNAYQAILMTTYIVIFVTRCLQIKISSTGAFFCRIFRRTMYQICITISLNFSDKYQKWSLSIFMYAYTWYELFYHAFNLSSNHPWNLPIATVVVYLFTPVVWVYGYTLLKLVIIAKSDAYRGVLQVFHVQERLVIEHALNGQELKPILTQCCIPYTLDTELCSLKCSILQCLSCQTPALYTDLPLSLWFVH